MVDGECRQVSVRRKVGYCLAVDEERLQYTPETDCGFNDLYERLRQPLVDCVGCLFNAEGRLDGARICKDSYVSQANPTCCSPESVLSHQARASLCLGIGHPPHKTGG
jgi:hypothetical protein